MKTPTWDRPSVKAETGVGIHNVVLPLTWIITGSKVKAGAEKGLGLA